MVGIGLLMIALGLVSLVAALARAALRRALVPAPVRRWPRRSASSPSLAGWITTEIGRQPWVVYGLLRTADAVSPVPGRQRARPRWSLFVVVYCVVFGAGIYYLLRLMRDGAEPRPGHRGLRPAASGRSRPPTAAGARRARRRARRSDGHGASTCR